MSTSATAIREERRTAARLRPLYELRAEHRRGSGLELSIWELPSAATPRLAGPECLGSLHGGALELLETRLLRRLKEQGIRLGRTRPDEADAHELDEDVALVLALLFRTLAPMRSLDRIRQVAEGIDRMNREEAAYWLGMAVHRRNPRRVLAALRLLLTST